MAAQPERPASNWEWTMCRLASQGEKNTRHYDNSPDDIGLRKSNCALNNGSYNSDEVLGVMLTKEDNYWVVKSNLAHESSTNQTGAGRDG